MLGVLLALVTLAGGGTWAAWRASGVGRAARRAKKEVGALLAEREATRQALERPARALREEAEAYVARHRADRRKEVAAETLRDEGAKKIRWEALQEAGFSSLHDVHEATTRDLMAVKGIGPVSAKRLKSAAHRASEALSREAVPLPDGELDGAGEAAMVRHAAELLETRRQLGDAARQLETVSADVEARGAEVARESNLITWIFGSAAQADRRQKMERARSVADEARRTLETAGATARKARQDLRELAIRRDTDRQAVREMWKQRRAELAAVLDDVLQPPELERLDVDEAVGARLPDQIVQRVEALELRAEELNVVLRRYQSFGARFLVVQERTILGDDMGLGKTMQSLAAMVHLRATGQGDRFLVVSPATVVPNWLDEIRRHTPLPCHELRGPKREEALDDWLEQGGVGVTSYSTLRLMEMDEVLPSHLDLLVADEAHFLKNPEAARTRAVAELLPMTRRVCFMTGTPIENRLTEFCMLVEMLRPGLIDAEHWDADEVSIAPAAFQNKVAGVYLRRNQADVLHELPDRLEKREWVDLDDDEARAYREAVASGNIMAMRRCSSLGGWTPERRGPPRSAKLDRLADLVEEHATTGRKVLVFSFFRDVLAALEHRLDVVGSLHGDVDTDTREEIMQRFRDHDGHAVLLGQITAAGVGLNLQAASVVVLMEPQWKPSTEEQAIARAHRMGQTERVVVHRLLARDSVDERVVELLEGKQELFKQYARHSVLKAASKEATETELAKMMVAVEQGRLDTKDGDGDSGGPKGGRGKPGAAPAAAEPDELTADDLEGEQEEEAEPENEPAA